MVEVLKNNRMSHDEYIKRLYNSHNGNISIMDTYLTKRNNSLFLCNICKHSWRAQSGNLIKKSNPSKCPNCNKRLLLEANMKRAIEKNNKTKKEARIKINEIYGDLYELKTEYNHHREKLELECKIHGLFKQRYDTLLSGIGCQKCGIENRTKAIIKSNEKKRSVYSNKFYEYVKSLNGEYECLSEYINVNSYVKIRHNSCSHEWNITPANFKWNNRRCPRCAFSKSEEHIAELLNSNGIDFDTQIHIDGGRERFDFNLGNSVIVEYDGEQHFYAIDFGGEGELESKIKFENRVIKDKFKNKKCVENGIPLIRLPYTQKNNLDYVLHNVLIHFGLINNKQDAYDEDIVLKYLVDENWDHDKYIEENKQRNDTDGK